MKTAYDNYEDSKYGCSPFLNCMFYPTVNVKLFFSKLFYKIPIKMSINSKKCKLFGKLIL